MKTLKKRIACLLFALMMICISCSKKDHSFSGTNNPLPLAGKEFQFNNLIWEYSEGITNVSIVILIPDLFIYEGNFEVLLKPDISSAWAWVPVVDALGGPQYSGFLYRIASTYLSISPFPHRDSLQNKVASAKIKFK